MGKSLPDGFIRDRGYPKSPDGLSAARLFENQPGYQLSLTARVGGNDNILHVIPVKLCLDGVILLSRLFDDIQLKLIRQHRKILHLPLFVARMVVLRIRQRDKMSQSPCYDIFLAFHRSVQ